VIKLAQTHSELSVRDSDSLQYFALEAFAYDIAVPGEGCVGKWSPVVVVSSTLEAPSVTSETSRVCCPKSVDLEIESLS
jgi:hypothetical protein